MIFDLIAEGKFEELENALTSGEDPNELYDKNPEDNEYGITPLFLATIKGDLQIVDLLIKFGANVNHQIPEDHMAHDVYAPNALSLASQARFLMDKEKFDPIVKTLIKNGAIDET